jgi:hypothetical protein
MHIRIITRTYTKIWFQQIKGIQKVCFSGLRSSQAHICHGIIFGPIRLGTFCTSCYNHPELRQQVETLRSLILSVMSEGVYFIFITPDIVAYSLGLLRDKGNKTDKRGAQGSFCGIFSQVK